MVVMIVTMAMAMMITMVTIVGMSIVVISVSMSIVSVMVVVLEVRQGTRQEWTRLYIDKSVHLSEINFIFDTRG